MATLTQMETQLAELTAKIDGARAELREHAALQIKALMAEFQVTAADLVDGQVTVKAAKKTKAVKAVKKVKAVKAKTNGAAAPASKGTRPAKYLDPVSGATWSGMGHTPGWMKDVKNRDKFLIATPAAE